MPCLHAISSALEEDPEKRMGSISFHTFSDNPFFRNIDFEALERKEIEPVFVPSSEKTNFDATYDLEELLLEEAPLEARARRQKPREQLKDDATEKEIREDELFRMIDNMFMPFDYTKAAYERFVSSSWSIASRLTIHLRYAETGTIDPSSVPADFNIPEENKPHAVNMRSGSNSTRKVTNSKSLPGSASGSPPSRSNPPLPNGQSQQQYTSAPSHPHTQNFSRPPNPQNFSTPTNTVPLPPLSPYQSSYSRNQRPTGTRNQSMGGGVQVVLGETGSWSELAKQDATLPADAKVELGTAKSGGMLGFLSRKKGRGHSPKPQERGILGKEGARVVISNGD